MNDKATFRAWRTMVGFTQQDLAAKFKVPPKVAANWEREAAFDEIPDDVFDYVRRVKAIHGRMVAEKLAQFDEVEAGETVTLTYYRSQSQYEHAGGVGYYALDNGVSLTVAGILEQDGVTVEWQYPPRRDVLPE